MKIKVPFCLWLAVFAWLLALACKAQTNVICVPTANYGMAPTPGLTVTWVLNYPNPRVGTGGAAITQSAVSALTDANGNAWFTNFLWGYYSVTVSGGYGTKFPYVVVQPASTGNIPFASLVWARAPSYYDLPPNPLTNYYTQAQSDSKYQQIGTVGTNISNTIGTNVFITDTNGQPLVANRFDTNGAAAAVGTTLAVNMTNAANQFTGTNLTVHNIQPDSSGNLNINAGSGNISANTFSGNGSGLTSITAGQVGAQPTNVNLTTLATLNGGSLTNLNATNLTGILPMGTLTSAMVTNGFLTTDGTTLSYSLNGQYLTNLTGAQVSGTVANAQNANTASYAGTAGTTTNLSGGALNLSTNIANGQIVANRCVTNGANVSLLVNDAGYLTNSAAFQPTNVNLTTLATLNGGSLTNLNASSLTSGTVPDGRLIQGTTNSTAGMTRGALFEDVNTNRWLSRDGQIFTNLQAANLVGNISASQVTGLPTTNTFVSTNGLFSGTLASSVTVPAAQVTGLPTTNTFASTNGTYPQMTVGTATVANFVNGTLTNNLSGVTIINSTLGGAIGAGAGTTISLASGATISMAAGSSLLGSPAINLANSTNLPAASVNGTVPLATTAGSATTVTGSQSNIIALAVTNVANLLTTNGNGSGLTSITAGQVGAQPTNVNLTTLATLNGGSLTNINALNITNLAATIGAQVGSSNYLTSASSLNYTKLTNAPNINTNYVGLLTSTNGYYTYATNSSSGLVTATFVITNLTGLNVAASAVTGTLTNNTTGNAVTASFASNGVTAMQSNILANAVTNVANLLTTNGNGQFLTNLQAANLVGNISASQVTGLFTNLPITFPYSSIQTLVVLNHTNPAENGNYSLLFSNLTDYPTAPYYCWQHVPTNGYYVTLNDPGWGNPTNAPYFPFYCIGNESNTVNGTDDQVSYDPNLRLWQPIPLANIPGPMSPPYTTNLFVYFSSGIRTNTFATFPQNTNTQNYYVNYNSGSDLNDGTTPQSAFQSIGRWENMFLTNTVCHVAAGTYTNQYFLTANNKIVGDGQGLTVLVGVAFGAASPAIVALGPENLKNLTMDANYTWRPTGVNYPAGDQNLSGVEIFGVADIINAQIMTGNLICDGDWFHEYNAFPSFVVDGVINLGFTYTNEGAYFKNTRFECDNGLATNIIHCDNVTANSGVLSFTGCSFLISNASTIPSTNLYIILNTSNANASISGCTFSHTDSITNNGFYLATSSKVVDSSWSGTQTFTGTNGVLSIPLSSATGTNYTISQSSIATLIGLGVNVTTNAFVNGVKTQ